MTLDWDSFSALTKLGQRLVAQRSLGILLNTIQATLLEQVALSSASVYLDADGRSELSSELEPGSARRTYPLEVDDARVGWLIVEGAPSFSIEDDRKIEVLTPWIASAIANAEAFSKERLKLVEDMSDAARNATKAKSEFLASMSHELRTPLNAIIGYSELLEEEAEEIGANMIREDLGKILSASHNLLALVNDVLDLSRVEAGEMELHVRDFELGLLIEDVVEEARAFALLNENTLAGVVDIEQDTLPMMHTDPDKLRQILLNLLSNACKFTHKGKVVLRARLERGSPATLVFSVHDTGIGIAADQIERLFEAFTQADSSTTRSYGGTGLGLTLCHQYTVMLGGTIHVQSTPGEGSVFEVRLPMTEARPASESDWRPLVAEPSDAENAIVLLIDDDVATQERVERILSREGVDVLIAQSGEEGLELAALHNPAMILLDVVLPGINGWTVLAQLKSDPALSAIPVAMVSIVAESRAGLVLGATEYLVKPFKRDRLLKVVRDLLRRARDPILIVEDEHEMRNILRRMLEGGGYPVIEARDGVEALEILEQHTPALILLDLMMPNMDGFQFLERVRLDEGLANVPVVVITAMDVDREQVRHIRGQVVNVLQKGGMSRKKLMRSIQQALAIETGRATMR